MFIKIRNTSILLFLAALIFAAGSVKAMSAAQEDETTSTPGGPIYSATIETSAPGYDFLPTETTTPEITSTNTIEPVLIETLPNTVSTINLFPISYTTQSGDTGGQPVNFMAIQDQAGAEDNPNAYVLFTPLLGEYKGIHVFQFPNTVSISSLQTLSLKVNYKGSAFTSQEWSWSLFNWTNQEWISIGTNESAGSDTWTILNFQTTQPSQFISSTAEIQVQLQSNNSSGDAKIDFETIELTYGASNLVDTPTATSTEVVANAPTSTPGELIPSESTQIYTPSIDLLPSQTPSPDITSTSTIELEQTVTSTTTETLGLAAAVSSPSVPILVLPESNVSITNYAPRLDWSTSKLPVGTTFQKYELQLAADNSFPAPTIVNIGGLATNSKFTLNWNLDSNKKYYWRVRAFNTLGKFSAWSQVGSFRTAPLSPTLLTPSDGDVLLNTRPVFDWNDVSGATSYRIQVSQNKTFTTLVTNSKVVPSAFTQITDLPENTTLYWRVQSISANGRSVWSAIQTINIASQPLDTNIYYVAKNGNNENPGTQDQPWLTIQKCLDQIQPGYTCEIFGGTYNEALVLKKSGTQASRITLKNHNDQAVTVNSGNRKTIVTGGRIDYYTIDGLRLIASFTPADQSDVSIELGINIQFSRTDKTTGNHGFVVRNCYIEGAVHFYGHNNLMENCELNGKNIYQNAIIDNFAASYDNVYRNNNIHEYITRGIWSMESTDNILIEGNTIHNTGNGVDCDGAAVPVTRCNVINNHFYNMGASGFASGIFLENCFNCLAQGNKIHDISNGAGIHAINYGNGGATFNWHTFNNIEYRNRNSNTIISGNLIYNYPTNAGLYVTSVNGLVINHNTFYNVGTSSAIGFHTEKDAAGVSYSPKDETITNNIFFGGGVKWFKPTTGLISAGNFTGAPMFVNPPSDLHLKLNSPACTAGVGGTYAGALPCQH
jgi:hypothetical protein